MAPLRLLALATIIGGLSSSLTAGTILVPDDVATIQGALEVAGDGDTIVVAPGTYVENLDFLGKALTLRSLDGPEVTIVDGGALDQVVKFQSGEPTNAILEGFTIRNGQPPIFAFDATGGGIFVEDSSPTIRENIIEENTTFWRGSGIASTGGSPVIENNVIRNNGFTCLIADAPCGNGGGIYLAGGAPVVRGNLIESNSAPASGGGVYLTESTDATLEDNRIVDNVAGFGGGVTAVVGAAGFLRNNLIRGNSAVGFFTLGGPVPGSGGGLFVDLAGTLTLDQATVIFNSALTPFGDPTGDGGAMTVSGSDITIGSSILWANTGGTPGIFATGGANVTVTFSDVQGGAIGVGNFDLDPLLVMGPLGDFYLSHVASGQGADSPAIDASDPASPPLIGSTRTDGELDLGVLDQGFHVVVPSGNGFRRGDVDGDGNLNGLVDGLFLLAFQFIPGSPAPPCDDGADADDSGAVNGLVDGLFILSFQFVAGSPPPPFPGPTLCGPDPTDDGLDCEVPPDCL